MDVGTYIHTKKVPKKYRVREDPQKEPMNLRLVAQALHLQNVDISSTQETGSDEKGPYVAFHPKPYGVEYTDSSEDLNVAIEKMLKRAKRQGGSESSDPFSSLFK